MPASNPLPDRSAPRYAWGHLRTSILAVLAIILTAVPLAAQQTGQVSGAVTSQMGGPLVGVQISIRGTGVGVQTNNQGRYVLSNVPVGEQTLVADFLGYGQETRQVTVSAGGAVTVDLEMAQRAVELEGVVVTGTAIAAKKREVGNSIGLVTAEQIRAQPQATIDQVLRSKVPGLTVQGTSGQAGAGSNLVLRGLGSVNGRNRPLIYVDGVRINDQGVYEAANEANVNATVLNSINPQDIERIEVIKGAAASTLYGTEAGAGVIQIFTKRGAPGKARWTLNAGFALATPVHVGPDSDPTGLHINDCTKNGPIPSDTTVGPDPGCPSSGSWLRDAPSQDYRLSVQGGVDNITYFGSAAFGRDEGIVNTPDGVDPQNARNINLRANFTFNGFEDVQIHLNNSYARRDIRWIPDGDNAEGLMFNVTFLDQGETPGDDDARVFDMTIDQDIDHFTTGASVNWSPRDNLRHRFTAGLDWTNSNQRTQRPYLFWNDPEGTRTVDIENSRILTLDYAGSWNFNPFEDIGSTFSWGGQFTDREELGIRGDCEGFVGPGSKVTENCRDVTNLNEDRFGFKNGGFFLQEQLGWKNRFFVTGGFRADTHSSFGSGLDLSTKFVIYPKLQATYTLSDHAFWPSWWETFRIRAAWGESGSPPDPEDSKTFWQVAGADENELGFIILNVGNPDIGPERTSEYEAGFDASLFDGRVGLTGTAFKRNTTDGLIGVDLAASNGIEETLARNVGRWTSHGLEATADLGIIESDNLRLRLNSHYQYIETEMLEFGPDEDNSIDVGGYDNRFKIGDPFPSTYGQVIQNPDAVGVLPEYSDTLEFQGQTTPPHEYSIGAQLNLYDRLTFAVFGYGQFGHVLLDDQAQELASSGLWPDCVDIDQQVEAWYAADQPDGGLGSLTAGDIARCSRRFAANNDWIFGAGFFRFQSATVSYRIPENWLPAAITGATLQIGAHNLGLITDYPGTDPDALVQPATFTLGRASGYTLPLPRTYNVNLRINF